MFLDSFKRFCFHVLNLLCELVLGFDPAVLLCLSGVLRLQQPLPFDVSIPLILTDSAVVVIVEETKRLSAFLPRMKGFLKGCSNKGLRNQTKEENCKTWGCWKYSS